MIEKRDDIVTLKAVGDIALFKNIQDKIKNNNDSFIFEKVSKTINDADLIFGNFEFACSNLNQPQLFYNRPDFCVETSVLSALSTINFDILNLSNNHIMDWGKEGLITTKSALEKLGILCLGAGVNINEASKPLVFVKQRIKVGFLGYTKNGTASIDVPGASLIDLPVIIEDISHLKSYVDHIIISLHWGVELSDYPHPNDIELAHKIIDAGASVILGHHPHVIQGVEEYMNGLIFYSLGSFLFDPVEVYDPYRHKQSKIYNNKETESIIAEIQFSKDKLVSYSIIPTKVIEESQVIVLGNEKKANCIRRINKLSENLKINKEIFFQQKAKSTILKIQIKSVLNLIKRNPWKATWHFLNNVKKKHIKMLLGFIFSKVLGIMRYPIKLINGATNRINLKSDNRSIIIK